MIKQDFFYPFVQREAANKKSHECYEIQKYRNSHEDPRGAVDENIPEICVRFNVKG